MIDDLVPTFPSKLDGGAIFFLRQNSEGLAVYLPTLLCTTFLAMSAALNRPASVFPDSISLRRIASKVVIPRTHNYLCRLSKDGGTNVEARRHTLDKEVLTGVSELWGDLE